MKRKVVFFRNDDVRHSIEKELVELVEVFLEARVPLSLAAEPANLTEEVVAWLRELKSKHPGLIEIIQHGYDHNKHSVYPAGTEFGTYRKFDDQYADIQKGLHLMDRYFPGLWFPAMAFPYGSFNAPALRALDKSDFKVLTTGVDFSTGHRIKDFMGYLLSQDEIFGKKVKQHYKIRKNYRFLEVNTCVNIIKKYLSEDEAIHYSLDEIIAEVEHCARHTSVIGILFHHRFHKGMFPEIKKLLEYLKNEGYAFSTLEALCSGFHRQHAIELNTSNA